MPQEGLSMRKVKEVLRLRFDLGLRQDQIARSCSIGQATVHRYLERATAAGLSWPLPDDCDDRRLDELLFPSRPIRPPQQLRAGVDFAEIHRQLKGHKHVTLAVALGRVSRNATGRLRLQPFLRVVPEVAPRSKRGDAPGTSSRRKDVRRLGRSHGAHLRSPDQRHHAGFSVRGRAGRQHLHLRASHLEPGSAELGRLPHCRLRVLQRNH